MKRILVVLFVLMTLHLVSQDYIILKNGDEIKAKVLEINDSDIDYKKYSNIHGPTYHLNKSKIFMIKYASGDKDVFNNTNSKSSNTQNFNYVKSSPSEFVYNPSIGNSNCQVQKSLGAKIYGDKASEVFFRQDLVFYGYDLTYLKLTNHNSSILTIGILN